MEKTTKKLYGGALVLAIGAFLSKVLGAFYRIPLTNLLGGEGLGLYQMIFPVYCVLLEFSGAGVPAALSKIIASDKSLQKEYNAKNLLINSVKFFLLIGAFGSVLMAALSVPIARAQGNGAAWYGYVFLSPAVVAVSVISCFRGYFQGAADMKPTALSQITEQAAKLGFGLLLAYIFMPNVPMAVGGAALGVTISELVSLLFLYLVYRKRQKKSPYVSYSPSTFFSDVKKLIKTTIPITLIGIALPVSFFIDSFILVNILNAYRPDATSLYGLMSGAVNTVINLPVAICYGVAAVAIPIVSSSSDSYTGKKNASKTLTLTFLASMVFAAFLYFFAPLTVRVLFSSFSINQKGITVSLIRLCSVNVVFLSVLQTQNAILIGLNRLYSSLISVSVGVAVKIFLELVLVKNPAYNVYGAAVAQIACYFIAVLINFIMIIKPKVKHAVKKTRYREYVG